MGKNQQKNTFNDASGLLNSFEGSNAADVSGAKGQYQGALGTAEGAYAGLNPAGISGILQPATDAATNVSKTGGYAQPQLNTLEGQEQSNLGGLDPNALKGLSSQYQDLISSGGISDATQAAMQRQATAGVSSIYGTLAQKQARERSVTGGQGGGGESAEMARQLSSAEANAVTGVNADVGQLRQQGTEAGLSGASNLASSEAAAKDTAARTFGNTQSGVASGIQTGANLLSGLGSTNLSGNLASAGGETALAGLTAEQQLTLQKLGLSGEQGFLGIMGDIANKQPNWYQSLIGGTQAIGGVASGVAGLIGGGG